MHFQHENPSRAHVGTSQASVVNGVVSATDAIKSFQVNSVARGIGGMLTIIAVDRRRATGFVIDGNILLSSIDNQPIKGADAGELERIDREIRARLPK